MPSLNDNPSAEAPLGHGVRSPANIGRSIKKRAITMKRTLPYNDMKSVVGIVLFVIAAMIFWQAVYTVPSDSVAVVQQFGKFHIEIQPGLHFKLPLAIDIATIVPIKRQLKQEFGFATPGANDPYQRSAEPIKSLRGVSPPEASKLTPEKQ